MTYVVSDIHGCYDKYKNILSKINFSEDDTLYILGDIVDRGPRGIKTLLDVAERGNVVFLKGNHDYLAYALLMKLPDFLSEDNSSEELDEMYRLWISDGGEPTIEEFLYLSESERDIVLYALKKSKISETINVGGKTFLLSHTVPSFDKLDDYDNWTPDDYVYGEPDYEKIYFEDKYIVTGHTPTGFIDKNSLGKIWKGNNHIAIDCGAVFGNPLGCLCLDTMEEFYSD